MVARLVQVVVLVTFVPWVFSDVRPVRNKIVLQSELKNSLYGSNESYVLTSETYGTFFNDVNEHKAVVVQFYNHWCPHCQMFRDIWLELRFALGSKWKHLIEFGVVNCARTVHVCKLFSVTGTPTVIYYPPKSVEIKDNQMKQLAEIVTIQHSTRLNMTKDIINVMKRNASSELCPSLNVHNLDEMALGLDESKYRFYYTNNDSNSNIDEAVIDFCARKSNNISLVSLTEYDVEKYHNNTLYFQKDDHVMESVASFGQKHISNEILKSVILTFMKSKFNSTNFNDMDSDSDTGSITTIVPEFNKISDPIQNAEIIASRLETIHMVKELMSMHQRDIIYLQDMKKSLNYSISHELNCQNDQSRQTAQKFLNHIYEYFPLDAKEKIALEQAISYVDNKNCDQLQTLTVFNMSTSDWIGCLSSSVDMSIRGYTCGLWQTFHYLTIKSFKTNNDSKNVLLTIRDYVKYFFGCQECKNHFLEMEKKDSVDRIKTNEEAILWLWRKHNVVNDRLHKYGREDKEFPKIQYPNQKYCPACFDNNFTQWNHDAVLNYLLQIYTNVKTGTHEDIVHVYRSSNYRTKRDVRGTIVLNNSDILLFFGIYVASIVLSICVYQYFTGSKLRRKYYVN